MGPPRVGGPHRAPGPTPGLHAPLLRKKSPGALQAPGDALKNQTRAFASQLREPAIPDPQEAQPVVCAALPEDAAAALLGAIPEEEEGDCDESELIEVVENGHDDCTETDDPCSDNRYHEVEIEIVEERMPNGPNLDDASRSPLSSRLLELQRKVSSSLEALRQANNTAKTPQKQTSSAQDEAVRNDPLMRSASDPLIPKPPLTEEQTREAQPRPIGASTAPGTGGGSTRAPARPKKVVGPTVKTTSSSSAGSSSSSSSRLERLEREKKLLEGQLRTAQRNVKAAEQKRKAMEQENNWLRMRYSLASPECNAISSASCDSDISGISSVEFQGFIYATLDNVDPKGASSSAGRQSNYLKTPAGWEISPFATDIVDGVVKQHDWCCDGLVFNNGHSYRTGAKSNGTTSGSWLKSGVLCCSGDAWKPSEGYSLRVLIRRRMDSCFPAPILINGEGPDGPEIPVPNQDVGETLQTYAMRTPPRISTMASPSPSSPPLPAAPAPSPEANHSDKLRSRDLEFAKSQNQFLQKELAQANKELEELDTQAREESQRSLKRAEREWQLEVEAKDEEIANLKAAIQTKSKQLQKISCGPTPSRSGLRNPAAETNGVDRYPERVNQPDELLASRQEVPLRSDSPSVMVRCLGDNMGARQGPPVASLPGSPLRSSSRRGLPQQGSPKSGIRSACPPPAGAMRLPMRRSVPRNFGTANEVVSSWDRNRFPADRET